jgi:hypothetical protein
MPSTQLLKIVAAMLHDPEVRRRFNERPARVMDEYALTAAEKEALLTMKLPKILAQVQNEFPAFEAEITAATVTPGEFPPPREDFFVEDGGADPMYPSPRPGVHRFKPRRPSANVLNNKVVKAFELVVFGQSLLAVNLTLKRISDGKEARLGILHRFGTYRASILRVVVSPPVNEATFTANDQYHVIVTNQPNTASAEDVGPGVQHPLVIDP